MAIRSRRLLGDGTLLVLHYYILGGNPFRPGGTGPARALPCKLPVARQRLLLDLEIA